MSLAKFSGDACLHQGWGYPAETRLQGETFDLTIFWLNCLNCSIMLTQRLGTMGKNFCLLHGKHWLPPTRDMALSLSEGSSVFPGVTQQLCNVVCRFGNSLNSPRGLKISNRKPESINNSTVYWASRVRLCVHCRALGAWGWRGVVVLHLTVHSYMKDHISPVWCSSLGTWLKSWLLHLEKETVSFPVFALKSSAGLTVFPKLHQC